MHEWGRSTEPRLVFELRNSQPRIGGPERRLERSRMARSSIFERYGGFGAVSKIVMSFYDKILDSDITGPYFDDVEMPRLMDHQTKFVASLMGGPASYTDDMLEQLHSRLSITGEAFDEMAGLFRQTLVEFNMDEDDIFTLDREITSRRHLVVSESE